MASVGSESWDKYVEETISPDLPTRVRRWASRQGYMIRYVTMKADNTGMVAWCRFFTDPTPGHVPVKVELSGGSWTANGEVI